MRISDGSADVCSSDLQVRLRLTDSHCPLVLERTRVITPQNRIEQRRSSMQDILANYGLWLLIALIVIAAIFFLLKGKASRDDATVAPQAEATLAENIPPPPLAPEQAVQIGRAHV